MLPWDFVYDHINYARRGSLYDFEMLDSPNYNPEFFAHCELGNRTINRSKCNNQSFNNVWTDLGIEQGMNMETLVSLEIQQELLQTPKLSIDGA